MSDETKGWTYIYFNYSLLDALAYADDGTLISKCTGQVSCKFHGAPAVGIAQIREPKIEDVTLPLARIEILEGSLVIKEQRMVGNIYHFVCAIDDATYLRITKVFEAEIKRQANWNF